VTELIAILSKAAQWNNTHREEARQLMAKRFGFKIEEAEMFEFYEDQIVPDINIQYWLDRLEAEKKIDPGQVKPDRVYTNQHNPANES
jgi:ABC-type nitrate/sulfonate/bicarbonate transport system substrate-binding protein